MAIKFCERYDSPLANIIRTGLEEARSPVPEVRQIMEDTGRREFLQHHFKRDPDDPSHYDLTLNLGTLSIDVAAEALINTLDARFPAAARASRLGVSTQDSDPIGATGHQQVR